MGLFSAAESLGEKQHGRRPPGAMAETGTAIVGGEDDILVREDWALTWPIWHMLSRQERKDIAQQHGYKTIGEFEEHMILQRAVDDSSSAVPYENRLIYSTDERRQSLHKEEAMPAIPEGADETNGEEDDEALAAELAEHKLAQEQEDNHDGLEGRAVNDEILKLGGRILILPDEMLHRAFSYLPVDAYATLARVSPHWQSFTRTEAVYKRLCERLYLNQSKRRALFVSRFDNSYRLMLERRPRVKAGGGVYVMKYTKVKPIQRDMMTEIPLGAVLELVYYRYLYFQEDGRVLYALTATPPHEMFPRFRRVCLQPQQPHNTTGYTDRSAVWGTYTVQRTHVIVTAQQEWQYVKLELSIDLDNHRHGRYGCLTFDKHWTSVDGTFSDQDRRGYDVPAEPFRFVKEKRL